VENVVSKRLLVSEFTDGVTVHVDHTADGYLFTKAESAAAVAADGVNRGERVEVRIRQ
jgi:hypothetical protein